MSPELVRHLSGRDVEFARARQADMVAVGSILHRLPTRWWNRRVDVWGTGLMHAEKPGRSIHRYHAVRGKLTAQLIGLPEGGALGDPGLLAALLFPGFADVPKRWDVGLVPHHLEQSHPSIEVLRARVPGVRTLNILAGTQEFLAELAACRFVLSSSLHGLIAADAFNIPNAWTFISDAVQGAGFKFRDYYSVFGIDAPLVRPLAEVDSQFIDQARSLYQRPGLEEIKTNLVRAFPRPR